MIKKYRLWLENYAALIIRDKVKLDDHINSYTNLIDNINKYTGYIQVIFYKYQQKRKQFLLGGI